MKRFHLCRWGYENQEHLKTVIDRNRAAEIPYVTQTFYLNYLNSNLF